MKSTRMGQPKMAAKQTNNLLKSTQSSKRNKIRMYKTIGDNADLYGAELYEVKKKK